MVAHVLPFVPEFAFAAAAVRCGRYGKLLGAHFKRVICRPDWSADIGDAAKTGGPAVDLHIHDTHFIGLIAGVPAKVFSSGLIGKDGAVDYLTTQYLYGAGGPAVSCSSGAVAMKGRPFVHGYEIYLERATLMFESGATPLTVYWEDGRIEQPAFSAATIRSAVSRPKSMRRPKASRRQGAGTVQWQIGAQRARAMLPGNCFGSHGGGSKGRGIK